LYKARSDHFIVRPLTIVIAMLALIECCSSATAQQSDAYGAKQSFGVSTSYSPDSSHILIGMSEQRRTWSNGFEYTRRIATTRGVRWDYEGSILPFYLESDPVLLGTKLSFNNATSIALVAPQRLVTVPRGPVGTITAGSTVIPVYAILGRQNTYAGGLAPLGLRAILFQQRCIQPSFAIDLGFLASTRDIPIDDTDQFNFTFAFGPGMQLYSTPRSSLRLEYLFHHVSNGHLGTNNPGVDQGTFRLTLSHHR
jgi:hypothetical protein